MNKKEFNLLDENWIRVCSMNGQVMEVSLKDALIHAHEYAQLAGETEQQNVAVMRVILAVLQTVVYRFDIDGIPSPIKTLKDALNRWTEMWELGYFADHPIIEYLDAWKERFWLFHPEYPFWQVPEAAIGTEYTAAKLNGEILESKNTARLFSAYSGSEKFQMSYAQASRWLIYTDAYDDNSGKPQGKGLPTPGTGWL